MPATSKRGKAIFVQRWLFDALAAPRPRAKPRKLMHVIDAGECDRSMIARFACKRCGHQTDWLKTTLTEARGGVPCPKCNR